MAANNCTFKLDDVRKLAETKFSSMGPESWIPICNKVVRLEQEMLATEHAMDQNFDEFRFVVHTGSSDDLNTDYETSDDEFLNHAYTFLYSTGWC